MKKKNNWNGVADKKMSKENSQDGLNWQEGYAYSSKQSLK